MEGISIFGDVCSCVFILDSLLKIQLRPLFVILTKYIGICTKFIVIPAQDGIQ